MSCISLLWPLSRFASPWLGASALRPIILCGQHSLEVFELGVLPSFVGHFATLELSSNVAMQVLVSVGGVTTMVAMADAPSWCNSVEVPVRFASHLSGGRGTAGRELRQMTPMAGDCDGLVAATPPARQESLSAMRKMVQLFNLIKLQVKCANQAEQSDWLTQAEDVRDNILSLVAGKRKHWHPRMRGRKGHG